MSTYCQVAGGDSGTSAIARKPMTAAADVTKVKKLKGRVMEDPISDEDDMFAEKSVPRRLTKENEEFLLERNKKYGIYFAIIIMHYTSVSTVVPQNLTVLPVVSKGSAGPPLRSKKINCVRHLRPLVGPKCVCRRGSARNPAGGAYSTPQAP